MSEVVRLSGLGLKPAIIKVINGIERYFLDEQQLKAVHAKYGPPGIDPKTDKLVEYQPKKNKSKQRVS